MELAIETTRGDLGFEFDRALRAERAAFAAKVRAARAVLGLSQDQFAQQIGLTQKSIHRIEQGAVEPKMRTVAKIEHYFVHHGIVFEHLRGGGFRLVVDGTALVRD